MKRFLKILAAGSGLLLLIAALSLTYLLNAQNDISKVAHLFVQPVAKPPAQGTVTVQFLGNTNLLFSDGTTSILFDGWFTRPGTFKTLFTGIAPDEAAIDSALHRAGVETLAAVIPVHSHYDHAMDSSLVAAKTGADLIGSESTLNIARGLNFDETRFRLVGERGEFAYGDFKVRLIKSRHLVFPAGLLGDGNLEDETIDSPLVPPANVLDYRMGGAWSILVEHPQGTALVQGSAGYVEGLLEGVSVDVVFLGIGGLMTQDKDYTNAYWTHVVEAVNPKKIYPIHWDSFTHPLGDEPQLPSLLLDNVLGLGSIEGIEWTERKAGEERKVRLLPMWEKVASFDE